jgi:hypothetical protein
MKTCPKCKISKRLTDFFKDNRKKLGVRSRCKKCCEEETASWRQRNRSDYNNYAAAWRAKNPEKQHASEIKRRYKLSIEQYNAMLVIQGMKCKICSKQHDHALKRGRLYVDHDHQTGAVRGLLCGACNSGLGYMKHNKEILIKALAYLA